MVDFYGRSLPNCPVELSMLRLVLLESVVLKLVPELEVLRYCLFMRGGDCDWLAYR